jgi:hypothetical protein
MMTKGQIVRLAAVEVVMAAVAFGGIGMVANMGGCLYRLEKGLLEYNGIPAAQLIWLATHPSVLLAGFGIVFHIGPLAVVVRGSRSASEKLRFVGLVALLELIVLLMVFAVATYAFVMTFHDTM